MLAAWAEQTSTIQFGPLVSCNSYRNPDLLADMARTVDHISGGRLVLGIGSGWNERDYAEFGYDFGTAGQRLDELGEALPRIEKRCAAGNPPPARRIPVLIGGGGERKTMPLVARHADIWHSFSDLATFVHKSTLLDDRCRELGCDPSEIRRSVDAPQGPPAKVATGFAAAGVSLFSIEVSGPNYDLSRVEEWVRWRDSLRGDE